MADQQIGNVIGVTAVQPVDGKIAEITADGANTFTVATTDLHKFHLGQTIDIRVKSSGADFAVNRTITAMTAAGVITYDGADVATVAGTHAVYYNGDVATINQNQVSNINGGFGANSGFNGENYRSIKAMKERLAALDATSFTAARMNTMTYNDLVYALRMRENLATVK